MTMGLMVALTAAAVVLAAPAQRAGDVAPRAVTPARGEADHGPRIMVDGIRFAPGRAGSSAGPVVWFAADGAVPTLDDLTGLLMRAAEPATR